MVVGMMRVLPVILFLSLAPSAHAFSVCPTTDFNIEFAPGDDHLDEGDLQLIAAGANRARQCYVNRIELIVEGDLTLETSLSRLRAGLVGSELIDRIARQETLLTLNEGSETYGSRNLAVPDTVKVLIFFN